MFKKIKELLLGKNTLYYPGCLTKFTLKEQFENYKKILNILGIDFITLSENEVCCGSPAHNAGYPIDYRKLAEKNFDIFKQYSVKKIITNCPACYLTFKNYKEVLLNWDIEVEHITQTIKKSLESVNPQIAEQELSLYHTSCHLYNSNIHEEPLEILRKIGYNIQELTPRMCCGAGAGLKVNNPNLANNIAKEVIKEAKAKDIKKIISTCPLCFSHLKLNSDIPVIEFSEAILQKIKAR